jgi:ABC-2 type transport system ATP-binding protein
VTVILVTHFMEEAERLADRLALIDEGRLVALDTPRGLVERVGLEQRLRFSTTAIVEDAWLTALPEVTGISCSDDEIVITGNQRMLFSVVSVLADHAVIPDRLRVDQTTLDDAFVALTGRRFDSAEDAA